MGGVGRFGTVVGGKGGGHADTDNGRAPHMEVEYLHVRRAEQAHLVRFVGSVRVRVQRKQDLHALVGDLRRPKARNPVEIDRALHDRLLVRDIVPAGGTRNTVGCRHAGKGYMHEPFGDLPRERNLLK